MLLKKFRAKWTRKAKLAADSMSGSAYESSITPPLAVISAIVLPLPAKRDVSHLGMQGYAPNIRVSQNRRYCEYCAERVVSNRLHVCWGNAEHHMHTLTAEDRSRILAQLANKPRKLTRTQLKKLYAADSLAPAEY